MIQVRSLDNLLLQRFTDERLAPLFKAYDNSRITENEKVLWSRFSQLVEILFRYSVQDNDTGLYEARLLVGSFLVNDTYKNFSDIDIADSEDLTKFKEELIENLKKCYNFKNFQEKASVLVIYLFSFKWKELGLLLSFMQSYFKNEKTGEEF
jgi:chloramphenicol O-acetyltransferase